MSFFFGVVRQLFIRTDTTLNGDTATLTIHEDTTGNGTFDTTESFTLTGGSEYFVPSKLELKSGNKLYGVLSATDDGDVTTAMTINSITSESDS